MLPSRKRANDAGVVILDDKSAPRVMFSGDRVVRSKLPSGTRVIYPPHCARPVDDVKEAIRRAIGAPENSDPLPAKLFPGMNVLIAVDDVSLPVPQMRPPDVRQQMLEVLLPILADAGVDDVRMVIATGLHRRMKPHEIKRMVGDRVFAAYFPDALVNHDAEDAEGMIALGETEDGHTVEISRAAATADLVIYLNVNFVTMNGGHKSVGVGLASYLTLRAHHNPRVMGSGAGYMEPSRSTLHACIDRIGKVVNEHVDVFHIECTLNNRIFGTALRCLSKNEDAFSAFDHAMMRLLLTANVLPQKLRGKIYAGIKSPYQVTGVSAGETVATHQRTLSRMIAHDAVAVDGQCDILLYGIPYASPYSVGAFLNPLLVQVMAQGYLFNMHQNGPLVKKGGTLIITHPLTERFDSEQHAAYAEFFTRLLPETRDAVVLHEKYEREFAENAGYVRAYRRGYAYHPVHPFFMWYWGEAGRRHLGRVIAVGADNARVPALLGYETADTIADAIVMARETAPPDPNITMVHSPPLSLASLGGGG